MNVVTFRCDDALLEEIDSAVEKSQFDNRAQYLRQHLANTIESNRIASGANHKPSGENRPASESNRIESLAERVDELEGRFTELEESATNQGAAGRGAADRGATDVDEPPSTDSRDIDRDGDPSSRRDPYPSDAEEGPAEPPEAENTDEPARPGLSEVGLSLEEIDVPGSGEKAADRREAVLAAFEYIRENERATASEIRETVHSAHPAGYVSGEDPARSLWKNCLYPALREIAEATPQLDKADTTGVWSFDPDEEEGEEVMESGVYDPTKEF